MARVTYTRLDFSILIRADDDLARIRLRWPGQQYDYVLPLDALPGNPGVPDPASFVQRLSLAEHLAAWRSWVAQAAAALPHDYSALPVLNFDTTPNAIAQIYQSTRTALLPVVTLDVNDPALAARPWEAALWPSVGPFCLSRVSPVRPSCLALPLALPLRVAHVDPQGSYIEATVQRVLGHFGGLDPRAAMDVQAMTQAELSAIQNAHQWPTVEALHFDFFQPLEETGRLLSVSNPQAAGSLGWLVRLTEACQTRLVVLNCVSQEAAGRASRLAHALVARGGPMVVVTLAPPHSFERFYDHLLHDVPLDVLALSSLPLPPTTQIFGGMGREEALRLSTVWINLMEARQALASGDERGVAADLTDLLRRTTDASAAAMQATLLSLAGAMEGLVTTWSTVTFDRERNGLLPLLEVVKRLRQVANVRGPRYRSQASTPAPGERFVNASLWAGSPDGSLAKLAQAGARLFVDETYHLAIQIGPRDVTVRTVGASALIEEVFQWTPDMTGVWVEVGVTGLDFDVLGSPVRALWLPRDQGPTETIYFAVTPRRPGAAWLRFCLYHQNNLVQSFRLAAVVVNPPLPAPSSAEARQLLARALALTADDIGEAGYLARLEYSLTGSMEGLDRQPARALSIVANEKDGGAVITLKSDETFTVHADNGLKKRVTSMRRIFDEISSVKVPPGRPNLWKYRFGRANTLNAGSKEALAQDLMTLAAAGWELYTAILKRDDRDAVRVRLEASEGEVIHVAHILLEHVIPWAAVYDRFYDAGKQEEAGQPVAHAACLAALPDTAGRLPVTVCGQHPACLLHPDQASRRLQAGEQLLTPATVACPLHFWGFKHIIEVPAQQVTKPGSERDQVTCISRAVPVKMAGGFHGGLALLPEHLTELQALQSLAGVNAAWAPMRYKRDEVLKLLEDTALHLVYLYCHCRGGEAEPAIDPPYLEFKDVAQPGLPAPVAGTITASQLDTVRWDHHPLVFLNACGTLAYLPDAQSPFVKQLVGDCLAAGVIGTEIQVWEQLATEAARRFLTHFLSGASAGQALLRMRRELLAQSNPLGLVYTLYAAAHLALDRDGDGICSAQ